MIYIDSVFVSAHEKMLESNPPVQVIDQTAQKSESNPSVQVIDQTAQKSESNPSVQVIDKTAQMSESNSSVQVIGSDCTKVGKQLYIITSY